jgi:hypothetical protein
MTITGTFTAAGQSTAVLRVPPGMTFSYEVTDSYTGSVAVQRAGKGADSWSTILTLTSTGTADIKNETKGIWYIRLRCVTLTAGTPSYALADVDGDTVYAEYLSDGTEVVAVEDDGGLRVLGEAFAGGGGGDVTIQTDTGTSPVGDVITMTSSDGSVGIDGDSTTDTVDFTVDLSSKLDVASPTYSGTMTTPLTASRAVVTGASSELAVSAVTATELALLSGKASVGDVSGPASSVDNTVSVFSSTTGKVIKAGTGQTIDPSTGVSTFLPAANANSIEIKGSGTVSSNCLTVRNPTTPASNFAELTTQGSNGVYVFLKGANDLFTIQSVDSAAGPTLSLNTPAGTHYWRLHAVGTGADTGHLRFNYNSLLRWTMMSDGIFRQSIVGKGLSFKQGTGTNAGNATLVAGTVTVTNTLVTANSVIILARKTAGGTIGNLTYTVSAATSFTITSDSATDTSVVSYLIVETHA